MPKETWTCDRVLAELRGLGEKRNIEGMARFGIVAKNIYGVSKPKLDTLARRIGRSHELALDCGTLVFTMRKFLPV